MRSESRSQTQRSSSNSQRPSSAAGKSVQVLAEKAGLRITGCVNELDTKDLYCYIYAPKEETNA